jgi:hypothetical protein
VMIVGGQVPAGRRVSSAARRDATLLDGMEFVAAVAEYAAASSPRLGTGSVRRSGGSPSSNRSSRTSSSTPRSMRRWSRRSLTFRFHLNACQAFRLMRFTAGSWRRWSLGR